MLFIDRQPIESWHELVMALPDKEFRKLTRSTVAHLDYWRDPSQRVSETDLLGEAAQSTAALHFEYQVASLDGATASHTDLTVISNDAVTGIEAKATEQMYENVGSWLSKGSSHRMAVLRHWVNLIGTDQRPDSLTERTPPRGSARVRTYPAIRSAYRGCIGAVMGGTNVGNDATQRVGL